MRARVIGLNAHARGIAVAECHVLQVIDNLCAGEAIRGHIPDGPHAQVINNDGRVVRRVPLIEYGEIETMGPGRKGRSSSEHRSSTVECGATCIEGGH